MLWTPPERCLICGGYLYPKPPSKQSRNYLGVAPCCCGGSSSSSTSTVGGSSTNPSSQIDTTDVTDCSDGLCEDGVAAAQYTVEVANVAGSIFGCSLDFCTQYNRTWNLTWNPPDAGTNCRWAEFIVSGVACGSHSPGDFIACILQIPQPGVGDIRLIFHAYIGSSPNPIRTFEPTAGSWNCLDSTTFSNASGTNTCNFPASVSVSPA